MLNATIIHFVDFGFKTFVYFSSFTGDHDSGLGGGFDKVDFQNLRLVGTAGCLNEGEGCLLQTTVKKPVKEVRQCFLTILWSPKILAKLELHKECNDKLYTTLGIGKMLSKAVINENSNMDWRKPFVLVISI